MIDKLNPDLRVSKGREFFVLSPQDAYELLEAIAVISDSQEKLKKVKNAENKTAASVQKLRRPPSTSKSAAFR